VVDSAAVGMDQADVDLILMQPTIGETAWVQIKSGTSQAELDDGNKTVAGSVSSLRHEDERSNDPAVSIKGFER